MTSADALGGLWKRIRQDERYKCIHKQFDEEMLVNPLEIKEDECKGCDGYDIKCIRWYAEVKE